MDDIDAGPHAKEVTVTYRSLRLALVLAVLMLAVSVLVELLRAGELRDSLSSYFYSPTRSIFVGVLLVIGFSLIAIHAVDVWEDFWLALGGMFAIVVAFVPTDPPACDLDATSDVAIPAGGEVPQPLVRDIADRSVLECFPHAPGDGLPDWIVAGIVNNVIALVATAALAVIVADRFTSWSASATPRPMRWSLLVEAIALAIGTILFWLWDDFRANTHYVAAVLAFVCYGAVAFLNGWRRDDENPPRYRMVYRVVVVGMVAAAVAFVLVRWVGGGFRTDVFWLEATEIALFATFWLAQTVQHWHELDPDSDEPGPPPAVV